MAASEAGSARGRDRHESQSPEATERVVGSGFYALWRSMRDRRFGLTHILTKNKTGNRANTGPLTLLPCRTYITKITREVTTANRSVGTPSLYR
jgi:hypothetical protein